MLNFYESSSIWLGLDRYWEHDITLCRLISKHQTIVYTTNLKYWRENIPENGSKLISIFCSGQFQLYAIYSMILDFVSWSVYGQLTSLSTPHIGQLWNLARLNDVRGISILSAKKGEQRKQVTAQWHISGRYVAFCIETKIVYNFDNYVIPAECLIKCVNNLTLGGPQTRNQIAKYKHVRKNCLFLRQGMLTLKHLILYHKIQASSSWTKKKWASNRL